MVSTPHPGVVPGTVPAAARRSLFIFGPLLLFTLSDILLTLLGEAVKTSLLWNFRYTDVIDLALIAPLYLLSFIWLEGQFVAADAPNGLRRAFLITAMLFLYGHAMHVTGNAVNTFSTEINDYRAQIPADAYALLYFLDETLSHYIVFITRFGIFACALLFDVCSGKPDAYRPPYKWALGLGGLYGIWEAVVFTEGQKVALLPVLAVGLGILWLVLWRREGSKFTAFLRSGVMTAFVAGFFPCIFIGMLLYFAITGGFVEPSKQSLLLLHKFL